MAITKRQKELDLIKWNKSIEIGADACGTFDYCVKCNKDLENPCDKAFKKFNAKPKSRILNTPLRYLKLKPNMLISAILRDGDVIIPSGNDTILENDNVIVVTTNQFLNDLNEILE